MVVALLALSVGLSGSGYAALKIDGKDIRKRSVPGNRIKDNALGGRQINEAKLRVVPAARNAETLAGQPASTFLPATGKAGDADRLDGHDATAFLGANARAVDSDKLDGQDSTAFLGAGAKAVDADKLDGLDSTAFLRGEGAVSRSVPTTLAPGATHTFTTPLSILRYTCPNPIGGAGSFSYQNTLGGLAPVWIDTGAGVTFTRAGVSPVSVATPSGASHLSVGAIHQLGPERAVQAEIYVAADGTFNECVVYMHVVAN